MRPMFAAPLLRLLPLTIAALMAACAEDPSKGPAKSEQAYYESAQKSIKAGNFNNASQELEALESHFPVGVYTEQAQLQLIYAKYNKLDYAGAAADAARFIRLHPGNPQADYAYYMRGLADYEAGADSLSRYLPMNPAHRDLTASRDAFADFRELTTRYPDSPYSADARQRMIYLRNLFAENEMHVARYYVRRQAWVGALARAHNVVYGYQGSPSVPEALALEVVCYEKLGLKSDSDTALAQLKAAFPTYSGLGGDGRVHVDMGHNTEGRSFLSVATFGLLGNSADKGQR